MIANTGILELGCGSSRSSRAKIAQIIFSSELVKVGIFRCPSDYPRFGDTGPSTGHWLVFPRTSVRITHAGGESIIADPNVVLLHALTGAVAGDSLGVDMLWLGDVNGDQTPDYMATATGNDFNGSDVGHVYIVSFQAKPAVTMQPVLGGCQPIQPR